MADTSHLTTALQSSLHSLPGWGLALARRIAEGKESPLDRLWIDSSEVMRAAGMEPDPWQSQVLRSSSPRLHLRCSRQAGKSSLDAALAVKTAMLEAPALVLIVSPTERQSGELMEKVRTFYGAMQNHKRQAEQRAAWGADGAALTTVREATTHSRQREALWQALPGKARESALQLHFDNGSRIIGLPGKPAGIVGYSSVNLLILDEASRISDELYKTVRPMLAVSRGRLIASSTPFGKRGWFYEEDVSKRNWERIVVTALDCPRIPRDFLEEEYAALGKRWFAQEYLGSYEAAIGQVFDPELIERAIDGGEGLSPWFTLEK